MSEREREKRREKEEKEREVCVLSSLDVII